MEGLGKVFLEADDLISRQCEEEGAYLDIGEDCDHSGCF